MPKIEPGSRQAVYDPSFRQTSTGPHLYCFWLLLLYLHLKENFHLAVLRAYSLQGQWTI